MKRISSFLLGGLSGFGLVGLGWMIGSPNTKVLGGIFGFCIAVALFLMEEEILSCIKSRDAKLRKDGEMKRETKGG